MRASPLGGDESPFSCIIVTPNATEVIEERRFASLSLRSDHLLRMALREVLGGALSCFFFFWHSHCHELRVSSLSCFVAVPFIVVCALNERAKGKKNISYSHQLFSFVPPKKKKSVVK